MKKNKQEEKLRKEIKEEVYNKYTDTISALMKKEYFTGAQSTFSTFLALNMCSEATKKNLIKMGVDSTKLEESRRAIITEIWQLMELYDEGTLKKLIEQHQQESESEPTKE